MSKSTKIKEARKVLGVSQQGLAVRLKCHVNTVSSWEQDRHEPSPVVLELVDRLVAEKQAERDATEMDVAA